MQKTGIDSFFIRGVFGVKCCFKATFALIKMQILPTVVLNAGRISSETSFFEFMLFFAQG